MKYVLGASYDPPSKMSRVISGLKSGVQTAIQSGYYRMRTMQFASQQLFGSFLNFGRSLFDYRRYVGDGRGNSIVMAAVLWICRTFPEAPIQVIQKGTQGERIVVPSRMAGLIARPNPYYSGVLLWHGTLADLITQGNAYWIKIRNKIGVPVQLWWVPAAFIEPIWNPNGQEYISYYRYCPNGVPVQLDPKDVIHFRYGFDPHNIRKGLSPLGSVLREIYTDDEAATYSAQILGNLGVPGVMISPGGANVQLKPGDAEKIKAEFETKFTNDNRGRAMVLSAQTDVKVLSFSPQQMELRNLRRLPEERVTAVIGLPAVVAGLGAGLDRSTFGNFREAREAAYESNIIPTQHMICEELNTQLLPEFHDEDKFECEFDLSRVRVLREDQDAVHKRAVQDFQGSVINLNEARVRVGELPIEGGDVFFMPTKAGLIHVDDIKSGNLPKPNLSQEPDQNPDSPEDQNPSTPGSPGDETEVPGPDMQPQ